MSESRWITRYRLQELLKTYSATLTTWQRIGLLRGTPINMVRHYEEKEIDRFLASCPHTFERPPTLDDLLSGRLVLLNIREVMALLNLQSRQGVEGRLQSGRIDGIKLGKNWRFSKSSVDKSAKTDKLKALNALDEGKITRKIACHVLGLGAYRVTQLVATDKLQDTPSAHSRKRLIVPESLFKLLGELLPPWIDPRDWVESRLEDSRSLVSAPATCAQLGINKKTLRSLLNGQYLNYIYWPSRQRVFITPDSIDTYLQNDNPLSYDEIGWLFGTDAHLVINWMNAGLLDCPIESHDHSGLYRPCLLAILRTRLNPSAQPVAWYNAHIKGRNKPLAFYEAAPLIGASASFMLELVVTNRVQGIKTLGGVWMIPPTQLGTARRYLRG